VCVVQRLQDRPQVPAQTVVQTLPRHRQRVQQLLQAIVSGRERCHLSFKPHSWYFTFILLNLLENRNVVFILIYFEKPMQCVVGNVVPVAV
jgi:hypothetical protein